MNRSPYNSTSNRSPSNSLPLRKAILGFLNFKTAAGLSQRSVDSYQRILEQWADYAGDKKVSQFTDHDINAHLVYTRTEYVPRRFGGDTRALSPKSLRNIWISLCAFFTWAHTEFKMENPMKSVPVPKFKASEIEPFTQEEIERMLKTCTYLREAETFIRKKFVMRRPTANKQFIECYIKFQQLSRYGLHTINNSRRQKFLSPHIIEATANRFFGLIWEFL